MTLFGPVLPYDLLRVARRGRYIMLRAVFALVLLGLWYLSYRSFAHTFEKGTAAPTELAAFAENFFHVFLLAQFVLVYILTPAYVGDAIAEEKERGTLDYLLATQLTSREIVIGKLVSRLASVALFLIVGLPILSCTLLFGGVSVELLVSSFAALLLTLLSVGAVSMWQSVHARTPRDAIMLTYLLILCYFVGWGFLEVAGSKLRSLAQGFPELAEVAAYGKQGYDAGNPFLAFFELQRKVAFGGTYAQLLPQLLLQYAVFHGSVTLLFAGLAVVRLRRSFQKHRYAAAAPPAAKTAVRGAQARQPRWKRPVGNAPMIWKEVYADRRWRMGRLGKTLTALLALACLAPGLFIIFQYWFDPPASVYYSFGRSFAWRIDDWFASQMNEYVKTAGTLLACIVLLGVGVRAASSIGAERDRQTLDGLLASPLTGGEIIFAKWWGSIAAMRRPLLLLAAIWFMGVCSGGLHVLAVPILLLFLSAYMGWMASLGILCAVSTRNTLRAVMATQMLAMFVGCGPWIGIWLMSAIRSEGGMPWWTAPMVFVVMGWYALLVTGLFVAAVLLARNALRPRLGAGMTNFMVAAFPVVFFGVVLALVVDTLQTANTSELIAIGLTPPAVLNVFTFYGDASPFLYLEHTNTAPEIAFCVVGVLFFAVAGMVLGLFAGDRFRRTCGRTDGRSVQYRRDRKREQTA